MRQEEAVTTYQRLDVSSWRVEREEAIGGEEKYWLAEPGSDVQWLFKPNKMHITSSGRWSEHHDVSEKIAGEIGRRLGIPCAHIELAFRNDEAGCISRNLKPRGWELQTGLVLLSGIVPGYVPGTEIGNRDRRGHSLENIQRALRSYGQPPDSGLPDDFDAFETFVGYLVFDAVVANRDRHDENWAVMRPLRDTLRGTLAGSFDHARAFGSSLREDAMIQKLEEGIDGWARRGTAWRFEHTHPHPVTLVELARQALAMVRSDVRTYWLARVDAVGVEDVVQVTGQMPNMSHVLGTFIEKVFATNRRRVLDEC